jgi:hypothetical protein
LKELSSKGKETQVQLTESEEPDEPVDEPDEIFQTEDVPADEIVAD